MTKKGDEEPKARRAKERGETAYRVCVHHQQLLPRVARENGAERK